MCGSSVQWRRRTWGGVPFPTSSVEGPVTLRERSPRAGG
ncbi:hypothetical protein DVS28_a0862 [Euzebya pacifica]|uniref:Uncharacterized protein n=1 Tax=Euzebya pacifica TaxID=1608957 RepID=A0A346XTL6_9ACTN|nr:hypothetical protein DVS28_a0862 [Euzebya pacifica]